MPDDNAGIPARTLILLTASLADNASAPTLDATCPSGPTA